MASKEDERSGWAVGGGFMLGLGLGFFLLKTSVLAFVGSIIAGIGVGLIVGALVKKN